MKPETKGIDLKLKRTAARVTATDLASVMGVKPSRISHIESRALVTDEAARRYLAALETLATVPAAAEVA